MMQTIEVAPAVVATGTQHAPRTGAGQVVVVHTLLLPLKTPLRAAHWACVSTMQPTALGEIVTGTQHAPRGTQMSLEQTEFAPFQVPLAAAHCASVLIWQTPVALVAVGTQHAPVGMHESLPHTLFGPFQIP